jgi:hypothetical protein
VYLPFGSIVGNTFVNDAAASTVGADPPPLAVVVAGAELDVVAAGEDVELEVELELLLPQPAANADTATVIARTTIRRAEVGLTTGPPPCSRAGILAP